MAKLGVSQLQNPRTNWDNIWPQQERRIHWQILLVRRFTHFHLCDFNFGSCPRDKTTEPTIYHGLFIQWKIRSLTKLLSFVKLTSVNLTKLSSQARVLFASVNSWIQQFSNKNISEGSGATKLTCGEVAIFNHHFIINLLVNLSVKIIKNPLWSDRHTAMNLDSFFGPQCKINCITASTYAYNKKLSYCRVTARCVLSLVILPVATQQCRNYLYDKSWPNWWYEVGGLVGGNVSWTML